MNIQGLTPMSLKVFEDIKKSDLFQEYILIGGTALSLQINARLSEDLDFCKWQDDPRINKSGRFSLHRMKTKGILSTISNGSLFKKEENFSLLNPKYNSSSIDIETFIREIILKEYGLKK